MARWKLLMAATVMTAGTIGCAHFDTVDDFPVPCVGGNCNGPAMAYAGPVMGAPEMVPPAAVGSSAGVNAPPAGELGPFGSQGGATAGPEGNAAPVPSAPNPPGDSGLLPPSDSPPAAPPAPGV
jgi:hypothetical protein